MDTFWTFAFLFAAAVFFIYAAMRACFTKVVFPKIDFVALGLFAWVMVSLWSAAKAWIN